MAPGGYANRVARVDLSSASVAYGPLTGTKANMSGRMAVVTKSPLTGTVTDSHHGGWSAARLR